MTTNARGYRITTASWATCGDGGGRGGYDGDGGWGGIHGVGGGAGIDVDGVDVDVVMPMIALADLGGGEFEADADVLRATQTPTRDPPLSVCLPPLPLLLPTRARTGELGNLNHGFVVRGYGLRLRTVVNRNRTYQPCIVFHLSKTEFTFPRDFYLSDGVWAQGNQRRPWNSRGPFGRVDGRGDGRACSPAPARGRREPSHRRRSNDDVITMVRPTHITFSPPFPAPPYEHVFFYV